MSEHEVFGFWVLFGDLEHHGPHEYLSARVYFPFAASEARADTAGAGVQLGFSFIQFGLQLLLFLFQFRQKFFICQSHGPHGSMAAFS